MVPPLPRDRRLLVLLLDLLLLRCLILSTLSLSQSSRSARMEAGMDEVAEPPLYTLISRHWQDVNQRRWHAAKFHSTSKVDQGAQQV